MSNTPLKVGRLALAILIGVAVTPFIATPASADPPPHAINDGQVACTLTGDILLPWHLELPSFSATIDDLTSVPAGVLYLEGEHTDPWDTSTTIWQLVPNGTTTSGLTFTWTETGNPQNTGTGVGTTNQPFPSCAREVSAEFRDDCTERVVTVTLRNESSVAVTFSINGTAHVVAGDGTKTVPGVAPDASGNVVVRVEEWFDDELLVARHRLNCQGPTTTTTTTTTTTAPPLAATGSSLTGLLGLGGGLAAMGVALIGLVVVLRRRRTATDG